MNRKLLAVLVAAAAAGAVLVPVHLLADIASCSVTLSSYADAVVNPSRGEDTEFFVSTGGVPNVMFVLDTSGSMRRLPKDGAAQSWGSFGATYGCSNTFANQRTFNSACGTTTLDGARYNPSPGVAPPDFGEAKDATGKFCPYMTTGNQAPGTNENGFDPDFYGGDDGSSPWFFEPAKVYHDAIYSPVASYDGWTDWETNPAEDSGGTAYASWSAFCGQWSGTPAKRDSCNACLRDQGYFFDGTYLPVLATSPRCGSTADCTARNAGTCLKDATGLEYSGPNDNSATCRLPHVWLPATSSTSTRRSSWSRGRS
jgi:hypothetical protein